jgi:hypothetical protein
MRRRVFLGAAAGTALALLTGRRGAAAPTTNEFVFLEAEGFNDLGGWVVDQQSMDQMGSAYLLAHGLGRPVADAVTEVSFPAAGRYRLWVRTRDWVAPWGASGAPGRFQVLLDGRPVGETFGTKNADWHWHDGGTVEVGAETTIALHDLTGFEGRCEALLFCKDLDFEPANDVEALDAFRRRLLGLPNRPDDGGTFDLVVVGGGLAGTCAAIAAARQGLTVALVQDRPVLGGNGSSEVRVWPEGTTRVEPFPHVGDIVEEILPDFKRAGMMAGKTAEYFADDLKFRVVSGEPTVTLFLEHRVNAVEAAAGRIAAVVAESTRGGRRTRLEGRLFADCTGDAVVGHLAGADYEFAIGGNMGMTNWWRPMDAANEKHVLACECKDKDALTAAFQQGDHEQPFPRCPWAIDLSDKPFPGRGKLTAQWPGNGLYGTDDPLGNLGGWFWESGFDKNPIEDVERIRDNNFRAMYGAWDALKNVDKLYPTHRLGWAAYIAGKRESRRLLGDVILSADDFRARKDWPDQAFPCSWHIDVHSPHPDYDTGLEGTEFISRATDGEHFKYGGPYWAPYRCLYSRNVANLFMAGRDISVTKEGLGPVRVMRTCGMMGEIVGKAAAICVREATTPRGVYIEHLAMLHDLMRLPGDFRARRSAS